MQRMAPFVAIMLPRLKSSIDKSMASQSRYARNQKREGEKHRGGRLITSKGRPITVDDLRARGVGSGTSVKPVKVNNVQHEPKPVHHCETYFEVAVSLFNSLFFSFFPLPLLSSSFSIHSADYLMIYSENRTD